MRDREAVERYINYAPKYLAGNDPYDYFARLLFMEVAVTLVEPPMAKLYDLKCQLIERLLGSFRGRGSLEQEALMPVGNSSDSSSWEVKLVSRQTCLPGNLFP